MCTLIHRAYDQRLFTSTQGTFSMRLADGSFLITPFMKDRKYLEPEDIVCIKNGMSRNGENSQPLGAFAPAVYEQHKDVNAVSPRIRRPSWPSR